MLVRRLASFALVLALAAPAHAGMTLALAQERSTELPGVAIRRFPGTGSGPSLSLSDVPGALALGSDARHYAAVTPRGELILGMTDGYAAVRVINTYAGGGTRVTFAAGDLTLVAAQGNSLKVYSTATGAVLHEETFTGAITGLATHVGPRAARLPGPGGGTTVILEGEAIVHAGGQIVLYDSITGGITGIVPAGAGAGLVLDGQDIAWFVDDRARLARVDFASMTMSLEETDAPVYRPIAPNFDGTLIAYRRDMQEIGVWSTTSQRTVRSFDVEADYTGLLMPDADTVLYSSLGRFLDEGVKSIDLVTGKDEMSSPGKFALMIGAWTSADDAGAHDDLASLVDSRASQGSVDSLRSVVDASLDVKVSTRASQASLDALSSSVGTRASQASLDALSSSVSTRASQASVDALSSSVGTRASQASLDALSSSVGTRASQASVDAQAGTLDSILGGVNGTNARLDGRLDAAVSTRASQSSVDALAADEQARADADADEHALILARLGGGNRQQVEMALVAGAMQPLFMVPAGAGLDPAALGLTCPGLPAAGVPGVDDDGLFEVVRCVTRRALDDLRTIGEDVTRAEREFAEAESDRMASPPRLRSAAEGYAQALQIAMRGR